MIYSRWVSVQLPVDSRATEKNVSGLIIVSRCQAVTNTTASYRRPCRLWFPLLRQSLLAFGSAPVLPWPWPASCRLPRPWGSWRVIQFPFLILLYHHITSHVKDFRSIILYFFVHIPPETDKTGFFRHTISIPVGQKINIL